MGDVSNSITPRFGYDGAVAESYGTDDESLLAHPDDMRFITE